MTMRDADLSPAINRDAARVHDTPGVTSSPAQPSKTAARSPQLPSSNGSAQESNLPGALLAPHNGFEVRRQHQHVKRLRGGT